MPRTQVNKVASETSDESYSALLDMSCQWYLPLLCRGFIPMLITPQGTTKIGINPRS